MIQRERGGEGERERGREGERERERERESESNTRTTYIICHTYDRLETTEPLCWRIPGFQPSFGEPSRIFKVPPGTRVLHDLALPSHSEKSIAKRSVASASG